jgi:Actin
VAMTTKTRSSLIWFVGALIGFEVSGKREYRNECISIPFDVTKGRSSIGKDFTTDRQDEIVMSVVEAGAATDGSLLLSQPVVIDNGTATIKAGFAGSSKPKVSIQ